MVIVFKAVPSKALPLTNIIEQRCPVLPEIRNGRYNIPECSNPRLDDRTFGTECKAQCNYGYMISESVTWTCGDLGLWSNYNKTVQCRG